MHLHSDCSSTQHSPQKWPLKHVPCLLCLMQAAPRPLIPAPQQHSALLDCLSQLNSDAWAQVLLPKLVEQGSGSAAALTCRQLRDLCFSSRQSITLQGVLESAPPSDLELWMQTLPTHFPNCTTVSLVLTSDCTYHTMPLLLPALARWVAPCSAVYMHLCQVAAKGQTVFPKDDLAPVLCLCCPLHTLCAAHPSLPRAELAAMARPVPVSFL
jgi:hypothetical protein